MEQRPVSVQAAGTAGQAPASAWVAGAVMGVGAALVLLVLRHEELLPRIDRDDRWVRMLLAATVSVALLGGLIWRALVKRRSLGAAAGAGALAMLAGHALIPFVFSALGFVSGSTVLDGASWEESLGGWVLGSFGLLFFGLFFVGGTLPFGAVLGMLLHAAGKRREPPVQ